MCVDAWKPYLIRKKLCNDDAYEQMNLEFRKDAMLQGENGIDVSVLAVSDLGVAYRIFCHNKNTTTCKVEHCRGVSKGILPGLESASMGAIIMMMSLQILGKDAVLYVKVDTFVATT